MKETVTSVSLIFGTDCCHMVLYGFHVLASSEPNGDPVEVEGFRYF